MKRRIVWVFVVAAVAVLVGAQGSTGGSSVAPMERELAEGVHYERAVLDDPRPNVLHWVSIDLSAGHTFLVSPAEPGGGASARTATELLSAIDADLAINANYFPYPQNRLIPWHQHPSSGELTRCLGVAFSNGRALCDSPWEEGASLFIDTQGPVGLERPETVANAISGRRFLIRDGSVVIDRDTDDRPYPRTAVGLDAAGSTLTWLVVDARVSGEREGLGLWELAQQMISRGVTTAIELDGGGSAEIAARENGHVAPLSQPSHREQPGWERAVPVHLALRYRSGP